MTAALPGLSGSVIGIVLISLSKKDRDYDFPLVHFSERGLAGAVFRHPALQWYQSLLR